MKRIVTIVVSGDIPDNIALSDCVVNILERHAKNIRELGHPASNKASGRLSGSFTPPSGPSVSWMVEWTATYEPIAA